MGVVVMEKQQVSPVPCNGCVMCCTMDAVRLMVNEWGKFKSEPHPYIPNQFIVGHKPNGDCYYLCDDRTGCTIQDNKPYQCRVMDCRRIAKVLGHRAAKRANAENVWIKGKELLRAEREK